MAKRPNLRTALLVAAAAAALVVVGAVTVSAGSKHGGGMLASLHAKMGGCPMGGVHAQLEQIVQKLDLTPEQQAYLDRAHAVLENHFHEKAQGHGDEMNQLVAAIGEGTLDKAQARAKIDAHLEAARGVAYGVSDELVGFVNSLDANQRAILREELAKLHETVHQSFAEHAHGTKGK